MKNTDKEFSLFVRWLVEDYEHYANFSLDRVGRYFHELFKYGIKYKEPEFIYKFYGASDKNLDSLRKGYLYFSNPKNFNDPWDCLSNREKFFLKSSDIVRNHRENIGVCCFSIQNENPLMWSHYTDQYKGFCLKFENKNFLQDDLIQINSYVSYLKNYNPVNKSFDKVYKEVKENDFLNDEQKNIILTGISCIDNYTWKSCDWEYEKEYRAISWHTQKFKRQLAFNREDLKEVYIGYKMKSNPPEDNLNYYSDFLGVVKKFYPYCQVFEVYPDSIDIKLNFNKIEL